MRPEQLECQCLALRPATSTTRPTTSCCCRHRHRPGGERVGRLVGQVAGLLVTGNLARRCRVTEVPGILARLRDHAGDPAAAWPANVRGRLPGPVGMYATLAHPRHPGRLGLLAWWLHRAAAYAASHPRYPARPTCCRAGRAPRRAVAAARHRGCAVDRHHRGHPANRADRPLKVWRGRGRGGPPPTPWRPPSLRSDPLLPHRLPPCFTPCLNPRNNRGGEAPSSVPFRQVSVRPRRKL